MENQKNLQILDAVKNLKNAVTISEMKTTLFDALQIWAYEENRSGLGDEAIFTLSQMHYFVDTLEKIEDETLNKKRNIK